MAGLAQTLVLAAAALARAAAGASEDVPRPGLLGALGRRLKFGYHVPTCPPLGGVTEDECPDAPGDVPSCETPGLPDLTICSTTVGDSCDELSFTACVFEVGGERRRLQEGSTTLAPTPSGELISIGKIGGEEVTASPTAKKYCPDDVPTTTRSAPVPRIIGGQNVSIEEYPWTVALIFVEETNIDVTCPGQSEYCDCTSDCTANPTFCACDEAIACCAGGGSYSYSYSYSYRGGCGGSIIADSWVLTAAHCISFGLDNPVKVRAGSTLKWAGLGTSEGQEYDIARILVYPGYDARSLDGDAALIEIQGTFDFAARPGFVDTIDLITEREVALDYQAPGVIASVTGWGDVDPGDEFVNPERLQMASFPIIANDVACHRDGATDPEGKFGQYDCSQLTDKMIVAGVLAGGKDGCQGDSGGPLAIQVEGRWLLVGLTSWGFGCAEPGFPGVYARVSYFLDFVKQYVPELFCPPLESKDPCTLQCEDDPSATPSPSPPPPTPSTEEPTISFEPTHSPSTSSAPTSSFSPTSRVLDKEEKMQCFKKLPPYEDVTDVCRTCCAECVPYNSQNFASTFYTEDYYEFFTPVDLGGQCACVDLDSVYFDFGGVRLTDEDDCIRLSSDDYSTNQVAAHDGADVVHVTGGFNLIESGDGSDHVFAEGFYSAVGGYGGDDNLEVGGDGYLLGGVGEDTCTYDVDDYYPSSNSCEACFDREGNTLQCYEYTPYVY